MFFFQWKLHEMSNIFYSRDRFLILQAFLKGQSNEIF